MEKGSENPVFMFVAVVFGILLVIMVVIWVVIPLLTASSSGLCWRDALDRVKAVSNDVKTMNSGSAIARTIKVQECVDQVVFLNGNQIRGDYASRFGAECLSRGRDLNIGIEGHRVSSLWTATGVLNKRIADCYTIRPADCEETGCSFEGNQPPLSLKPGTSCVTFGKQSPSTYTVKAEEGACTAEER